MIKRILIWLRQSLCFKHDMQDYGEPYLIGYTTAPYPAIDEYEQDRRCAKCGLTYSVFSGFVMEDEHNV